MKAPKPVRRRGRPGRPCASSCRAFLQGPLQGLVRPLARPALAARGSTIQHDTGLRRLRHLGATSPRRRGAPPRRPGLGPREELRRAAARPHPARRRPVARPGRRARSPIVEYSDMQCPFCKKRAADFDALVAKLGKELKIRRVSKAFPIGEHTWAFRAASAGACFFDKKKEPLPRLEVERLRPAGDALRRRARHVRPRLRRRERHPGGGVPLLLPAGERGDEGPRRPLRGLRRPRPVDADLLRRRRPALLVLRRPDGGVPPEDVPQGGRAPAPAAAPTRGEGGRDPGAGSSPRPGTGTGTRKGGAPRGAPPFGLLSGRCYFRTNGSGTTIQVFTFTPSFVAGVHCHCFTAATLASPSPTFGVVSR